MRRRVKPVPLEEFGKDGLPPLPPEFWELRARMMERNRQSLHDSTRLGDIERVRELLDEGADVNGLDIHGHAPLMWAAAYGRLEILRLLIARGADVAPQSPASADALYHAAICGHPDTVAALLEAGVDPNQRVRKGPPSGDQSGHTALLGAVRHRRDEVVRLLLAHGADANAPDEDGHTPWQLAATGRRPAAIREMLKAAGAREE